MTSRFVAALLLTGTCLAAKDEDAGSWKHPEPITYESLRLWHKAGGLQRYLWPKQHFVDLNDDGRDEVFLGVSGYGRGMTYALFTKTQKGWSSLSDEIEGSHHPFARLPGTHGSWHSFRALLPSGRGGLIKLTYTWNGKRYVTSSERDITRKELLGE